jgi:hypothetical protein
MSRIFLSHSSADNAQAIAVRDWMIAHGWNDVFLDLDSARGLKAGERWQEALKRATERTLRDGDVPGLAGLGGNQVVPGGRNETSANVQKTIRARSYSLLERWRRDELRKHRRDWNSPFSGL